MCRTYSLNKNGQALRDAFEAQYSIAFSPRHRIEPGQEAPVVCQSGECRAILMMQWGLVPPWSKASKPNYCTINARAETVADKPVYKMAFHRNRCLVPATSFFEWVDQGAKQKQPLSFHPRSRRMLAFAGVWDRWEGDGKAINYFSIIVAGAGKWLNVAHGRIPVILEPEYYREWLDPDTPPQQLQELIPACPESLLDYYPVSLPGDTLAQDEPKPIVRVAAGN